MAEKEMAGGWFGSHVDDGHPQEKIEFQIVRYLDGSARLGLESTHLKAGIVLDLSPAESESMMAALTGKLKAPQAGSQAGASNG